MEQYSELDAADVLWIMAMRVCNRDFVKVEFRISAGYVGTGRWKKMSKILDAEEFLTWLDEAEEELRKERRKDDQTDKRDEGILVTTGIIREYVEKTCKINEAEGMTGERWIPIGEQLPRDESYILVSFENATMPDIARYEDDNEGGAFYPGDDEKSYSSYGLFVNAWMPLPKSYKEE